MERRLTIFSLLWPNHWAMERRVLKILFKPMAWLNDNLSQALEWRNQLVRRWRTRGGKLGTALHKQIVCLPAICIFQLASSASPIYSLTMDDNSEAKIQRNVAVSDGRSISWLPIQWLRVVGKGSCCDLKTYFCAFNSECFSPKWPGQRT